MEETMVMNGQQPVGNKKVNKNNLWKSVVIGGVSGIVLGGAATAAVAATKNHLLAEDENNGANQNGGNGTVHVDESVPVAQVSDDMSFSEAFHAARVQVGPGGVFVWHGQVYGTFTEEEWNSMTPAEQTAFGNRVHVQYDDSAHTSEQVTAGVVTEPATEHQPEQGNHVAENDGNTSEQQEVQVEVQEPSVISPVEPEVEILSYETISNEDGSQMDFAVVSVQQMGIIDVDQDGTADLIAVDANNSGQIDEDEIFDISSEGLSMQTLQDDYLAQNDSSMQGPDYINDGNVDNYMA